MNIADRVRRLFSGVCLLLVCLSACHATDGPVSTVEKSTSWSSYRHNSALTGVATGTLPDDLELLWETTIGDQILATAAVVDEFVYVPCLSGELACLRRRTGSKVWGYKTIEVVPKNSFAPGFKTAPTVSGDAIYLGDEEGVFHAISRKTGSNRWKFATGGEIYSAAAVIDGLVVFGSYDGRLYCLNEVDGTVVWQFQTQGRIHCAPAIVNGLTFIAGCDQMLRVIELKTGNQVAEVHLESPLIASPVVIEDLVYVATYGGEAITFDWRRKRIVWRNSDLEGRESYSSSPSITDTLMVIGGRDRQVRAIRRSSGENEWMFATRGKVDSAPAVADRRVFIGARDGNLYSLALKDGRELWKFNAGKPISAGPAIGEGVLVIGTESRDGKVFCFGKK